MAQFQYHYPFLQVNFFKSELGYRGKGKKERAKKEEGKGRQTMGKRKGQKRKGLGKGRRKRERLVGKRG